MSTYDRKELIDQANTLGLEFKGNISNVDLAALVAEAQGPAVKAEEPKAQEEAAPAPKPAAPVSPRVAQRRRILESKKKAFKTRIVTITNKDKRENEVMTTCHLSVENQHFGISKIVPLDVKVELEECLINVAETTMMTLHKDEIKNGQRTGNKVAVPSKKFIVSYAREEPEAA